MKILKSNPIPTYMIVEEISKSIKIYKRTKKGKKQALNMDIAPSFQTRQLKNQLKKSWNDNPNLNFDLILNEMVYLNYDIKLQ